MSCVEVNLTILETKIAMAKAVSGIPFIEPFVISDGSTTNLHHR